MTEPQRRAQALVRRLIWAGRVSIALSALCLYLSGPIAAPGDGHAGVMWAVYLMLARLFGIGAFAIGGVAIFNHRWTEGILLCLIAVSLPFLSLYMHGTI
jgi:hypothetical protein